jgi:salicylate hydroxylase
MSGRLNVGIVGAGIGGLTAAVALRRKGFAVTIFEKADRLAEIGAGIIVGPNAMKVLRGLGLDADVERISVEPQRHLLRSWKSGRILFDQRMKDVFQSRFGAGYFQAHRADLLDTLIGALPPDCIRLRSTAVSVRSDATSATLVLEDGSERSFDVVVGADGIKSAVRESLYGAESPRFTGNVCWRGVVPCEALPDRLFTPDIHVWLGPNAHIVNYYVRGGRLMNFVATHEADDWRSESWAHEADRSELVRTYRGWNDALLTLFERASHCYKWAIFDRDPLVRWSKGRATLLGDAAHPMLPYLAQGAGMAMEDGYVLAAALARQPLDVEAALIAYEQARLPRTTRTQLGARARAAENHLTSPFARLRRDLGYALRRVFRPAQTSYKAEWLYSYDVKAEFG